MKTKEKRKKSLFVVFLVGVVFFLLLFFVYRATNVFSIQNFSFEGVRQEDVARLQSALEAHKQKTRFLFFTNNSVITPNERGITEEVFSVIPSIKNIEVTPKGLHEVRITVEEHVPLFAIATGTFLTKEGVLFKSYVEHPPLPSLELASSTTKQKNINGIPFVYITTLTRDTIASIVDFSEKISTVLFPVSVIVVDEHNDIIFFDKDGVGVVKSTLQNLTQKTWTTFISAIDTEPLKSKIINEKDSLRYIDIRFGNKVFYSFSEGNLSGTSSVGILSEHAIISTTTSATGE